MLTSEGNIQDGDVVLETMFLTPPLASKTESVEATRNIGS